MRKRIILWTQGIDYLLTENKSLIGGIPVQMYSWAKIFYQNNWAVYSFTGSSVNHNEKIENIHFLRYPPSIRFINPVLSLLFSIYTIIKVYPKCIILSGATRDLLFISLLSKLLGVKLILLFASDSDLEDGKELIARDFDKRCYRLGVHFTNNFIVQNEKQEINLNKNYKKKNYISVPNIWSIKDDNPDKSERKIILWVGNFRKLKRPSWFIRLAKEFPGKKFKMVGGVIEKELFNECKNECEKIPNIEFSGPLSFLETRKCFNKAYLYICTSEIEGFPNTFVQAWSNNIPVISTFDPSNVIQKEQLGIFCNTFPEVKLAVQMMENQDRYRQIQSSIMHYMTYNHSPQEYFDKLIDKFSLQ
jgi:glycosyltransferase involved in cell wall biosynthesis